MGGWRRSENASLKRRVTGQMPSQLLMRPNAFCSLSPTTTSFASPGRIPQYSSSTLPPVSFERFSGFRSQYLAGATAHFRFSGRLGCYACCDRPSARVQRRRAQFLVRLAIGLPVVNPKLIHSSPVVEACSWHNHPQGPTRVKLHNQT